MNSFISAAFHRIIGISICSVAFAVTQSSNAADKNSPAPESAIFATSAASGGHLIIKRSPNLGKNITLRITIDDKPAGFAAWSQTYDKYITPGRHVIRAEPRSTRGAWSTTIDVRPHQTYFYTAYYKSYQLVLSPGKENPSAVR